DLAARYVLRILAQIRPALPEVLENGPNAGVARFAHDGLQLIQRIRLDRVRADHLVLVPELVVEERGPNPRNLREFDACAELPCSYRSAQPVSLDRPRSRHADDLTRVTLGIGVRNIMARRINGRLLGEQAALGGL